MPVRKVEPRRFQVKAETIQRELRSVIEAMGATSLAIHQDILKGSAEIVFDRAGQRYTFRCDRYAHPLDNLRAAQLAITYIWRALEGYGVLSDQQALDEMFARLFLGFTPLPGDPVLQLPSGLVEWWEVLGVEESASAEAIHNAFRALSKVHHPDLGGSAEEFKRLRNAYEAGMTGRK